ncbi:hypothetical protein Tco_0697504 [Tanacetum coccineum]
MVAYLQKSKGSEGFHQVIDFLTTSHIKYAFTKNPTIYVSLIHQFWETASASTSENGEMEITATIDRRIKTVTEASIRRHLKLEDSDGIPTLPNAKFFEQLALMGDEGSLTLNELMVLYTTLSKKVEDFQNDLKQTELTYGAAYTKLILRVKKLKHKGRIITEIDQNPSISLVQDEGTSWIQEDAETQGRTSADTKILTASEILEVSTAIPERQVYIRRSEENRKDKGKAIMKDINEEERKRIARDAEIAKQLQEEIDIARQEQEKYDLAQALELQKELDKREEVMAKTTQAHDIDWSDLAVLRYHAQQNRSFSKVEARKNMFIYLKNQGGYKQSHLRGMSYEDIRPIFERKYVTTSLEGNTDVVGDLKTLFEPDEENEVWRNQHGYNLISWRLIDSCGIHILLMDNGIAIHMMVEKKYPLIQEMLSKMLNRKLEIYHESKMAFELLRFIRSQLQK